MTCHTMDELGTPDLRIIQEEEVSELVRKVEFLDYLAKKNSRSDSVSKILPQVKKYAEEIDMFNTAVSMYNEDFEGEFTPIVNKEDYSNPLFKEFIEWGEKLRKWRLDIATERFSNLVLEISKAIPRGDKYEEVYREVFSSIVAGKNATYLKQEAGIEQRPLSGMAVVECVACERGRRMLERYFEQKGENS